MYNLNVKYVGAKSVWLADTFSRLVKPGKDKEIQGLDVTITQVLKIGPTHLERLQEETMNDQDLKELKDIITSGWPEGINNVSEATKPYWYYRDKMAVLDGLVLKWNTVLWCEQSCAMKPSLDYMMATKELQQLCNALDELCTGQKCSMT